LAELARSRSRLDPVTDLISLVQDAARNGSQHPMARAYALIFVTGWSAPVEKGGIARFLLLYMVQAIASS
jgi:hypothetical protein